MIVFDCVRALRAKLRPVDPEAVAALAQRWDDLPAHVKTDGQLLGRRFAGCEGTHGVFPRCNLACTPCYHSRDANRVRIDGDHTVAEVDRQMAHLREVRGPVGYAQLIGGEVSLLNADDHARALLAMERHGRHPMSFTHGDFDYERLRAVAIDAAGHRRLGHLAFAGHFDSLMLGRRGIPRPRSERDLMPYRARFVSMFERLRREHGVSFLLAHNMTVSPRNIDEIGDVVRDCIGMRFRVLSFQPAARLGNPARWREAYDQVDIDAIWRELERGVGRRLPHGLLQVGDARCNRTTWGLVVGDRWIPLLDDREPRDLAVRDAYVTALTAVHLGGPRVHAAIRLVRAALAHPGATRVAAGWALRLVRRAGALALLRHGARPLTFVVHAFMDEAQVRPAWEGLERGEDAAEPAVRATQERLRACSYVMAHPDADRVVPACVQHAVLDADENRALACQLPLVER